jgi:uncharacterized protein YkwD
MNWLVKLVAAAVSAGLSLIPVQPVKPVVHPVAPAGVTSPRYYVKADADSFLGRRSRPGLPAPTAEPTPDPAANPADNPVATLPIAAPQPAPRPAPPAVVIGSTQQALINQDRAAAGLPPLTWNSCLASVAYQNAVRMANQGYISHANGVYQDLACGIGSRSGENVGYWSGGINDAQLNTMFMNSPEHRANILGPYRYIGTAWVVARNGYAYIAVEFD